MPSVALSATRPNPDFFEPTERSDVYLAELWNEVDVCGSAESVGYRVPAMVVGTRTLRMSGHAGCVAQACMASLAYSPGCDQTLLSDIEKIVETGDFCFDYVCL